MSRLQKVSHVLRRFVPSMWGGIESFVYYFSKNLLKEGICSSVYTTDMFSKRGKEVFKGIPVYRYPYTFPFFGLSKKDKYQMALKGGSPLSFSLFKALLKEKDLSLIHTHVQHRLGGIARSAAKIKKIPYVVSLHGGFLTFPKGKLSLMQKPFENHLEWGKIFGFLFGSRRCIPDADAIICVGKDEYLLMRELYPLKRVYHIPNGVDIQRFEIADPGYFYRENRLQGSDKIILCVSRIDEQKDQLTLIRAFKKLITNFSDYKLVLIGPVSQPLYERKLKEEVNNLCLKEKVLFIPGYQVDDPRLFSAYKAADLFVLPSKMEPFGIVLLEAWAAKTPVVTSNVGGIVHFTKDGENVLHFDAGDVDSLYQKMKRVLEDSFLKERLKDFGYKEVKRYSWENISKQVLDVYKDVLKR